MAHRQPTEFKAQNVSLVGEGTITANCLVMNLGNFKANFQNIAKYFKDQRKYFNYLVIDPQRLKLDKGVSFFSSAGILATSVIKSYFSLEFGTLM